MINGLFNIGQSGLNAAQAWISVTGNNLANAETEGYSRQYVDQKDAGGLTYRPGAQPLGVNAQQIMRFFDAFLERSYVSQSTNSSRWNEQDTIMATVENLFNESNRSGLSSALNNFLNAWQDLALRPDDTSVRTSLVSYADNLSDMFTNTAGTLREIQNEMDVNIAQAVKRVNEIAEAIADLNGQITQSTIDGISNPNALLDKRDQLVRELSTYVDVETIDHGKGDFRVQLKTGQPLVDKLETNKLEVRGPMNENRLISGSSYEGKVEYQGTDDFEYTLEIIADPKSGQVGDPPQFRVSLDNGKTWLKDTNGKDLLFDVTDDPVKVKELTISFTKTDGFSVGDKFDITPKSGLYWIEPTRGPQNITPQMSMNGQENPDRVTGGKLASYYFVRDDNIGRYMDELDAVANSIIWEVNRLHSQGSGLTKLVSSEGQQVVANTKVPLNTAQAQLPFGSRLQAGNVNFHFYDSKVTDGTNYTGSAILDFTGIPNDEATNPNFDPSVHSLNDVVKALNKLTIKDANGNDINPLKATIQAGTLQISSNVEGMEFALGEDTSGLMAALGINSFFSGSTAADLAVASAVHANTNLIAAGSVNGQFEVNPGDNLIATAIGELVKKDVTITTFWKTVDNQTLGEYYAGLVSTVGADRRLSKTNAEYNNALTTDLFDRVNAVSGVNMDEEMSNLIKFQHSYTAAAKLITTADQMLQTLLGMKQ